MPKSKTRTYRGYSIARLVCRDLYIVSSKNGMHVVTGITAAHARRLIDAVEAAQQSHPKPAPR